MLNYRKIAKVLIVAAFFCTFINMGNAFAQALGGAPYEGYKPFTPALTDAVNSSNAQLDCQKTCPADKECVPNNLVDKSVTYSCQPKKVSTTNTKASGGAITGCSKDLGMFSGLITTGRTIFTGLRDLIYVVAGFGIIGVAVGGFFGNLNWKWLGALIIGLIVIATTGELINAITGCENFTSGMITDTLK